jgi:signal transduction histidine kinase
MLALFILTRKATTVSFVNSRVIVQSTADFLFPVLLQTVIVTTIIAGLATIFITLFISHKIAGPIYRFKKVLAALSEGDFSIGCKIRRTDSLQDVAAAFSDMITSVNSGFKSTEYSLNRLEEKIKALNLKDKESPEIKELREIVLELDKALHYFKF